MNNIKWENKWCWWQYLRRQLNKNFFGWLVQYQNNFLQIKYPKKILFPDITSAISKEPFSDITSAISKGRSGIIFVQTGEIFISRRYPDNISLRFPRLELGLDERILKISNIGIENIQGWVFVSSNNVMIVVMTSFFRFTFDPTLQKCDYPVKVNCTTRPLLRKCFLVFFVSFVFVF